jgi:RNA polymerase sigma factor (sigma-70 family)
MGEWRQLIQAAQSGDVEAFDLLVVRFRDMAVGYAYSILRDFGLAEDASQEAFIQAYRDLKTLREPKAFPAWLRRIVFKQCDRLSRGKRLALVPMEEARTAQDQAESPLERVHQLESRETVMQMVDRLPESERAAITLFYINGYSMAEVGDFLETPTDTIKSRLHSARKKLKERSVAMVQQSLRKHAPGGEFNERVRRVLTGVPMVSFELHRQSRKDGLTRCPESNPFPSCLRACLEYLGEDMGFTQIEAHGRKWRLDRTYVFLMGASGAAFRLNWKPGWRMDNPALSNMCADPLAPYDRATESVGYRYDLVQKEEGETDPSRFLQRIVESIRDRRCPVIAHGVIGPPVDCLITGFDDAGKTLIGWSYFQRSKEFSQDIQYEPGGYFRKRDWFQNTHSLFVLGEKVERPRPEESYRKALQWALEVSRVPETDRPNGLAAYRAWADQILDDSAFVGKKAKELRHNYHVHQDAVGIVAEGRWYAHNFIHQLLAEVPAPETLEQAARNYDDEHTLMWQLWGLVGGPGYSDKRARLFVDREIRKKTARIILQAQERDRAATDCIEAALHRW